MCGGGGEGRGEGGTAGCVGLRVDARLDKRKKKHDKIREIEARLLLKLRWRVLGKPWAGLLDIISNSFHKIQAKCTIIYLENLNISEPLIAWSGRHAYAVTTATWNSTLVLANHDRHRQYSPGNPKNR